MTAYRRRHASHESGWFHSSPPQRLRHCAEVIANSQLVIWPPLLNHLVARHLTGLVARHEASQVLLSISAWIRVGHRRNSWWLDWFGREGFLLKEALFSDDVFVLHRNPAASKSSALSKSIHNAMMGPQWKVVWVIRDGKRVERHIFKCRWDDI